MVPELTGEEDSKETSKKTQTTLAKLDDKNEYNILDYFIPKLPTHVSLVISQSLTSI